MRVRPHKDICLKIQALFEWVPRYRIEWEASGLIDRHESGDPWLSMLYRSLMSFLH